MPFILNAFSAAIAPQPSPFTLISKSSFFAKPPGKNLVKQKILKKYVWDVTRILLIIRSLSGLEARPRTNAQPEPQPPGQSPRHRLG